MTFSVIINPQMLDISCVNRYERVLFHSDQQSSLFCNINGNTLC